MIKKAFISNRELIKRKRRVVKINANCGRFRPAVFIKYREPG